MSPSVDTLTLRMAALALVAVVAGCGGGSDGGGTAASPAPPRPSRCNGGVALEVVADEKVAVGRVAGAAVLSCRGTLAQVRWTQSGGEPVELLSDRAPTIAFEAERPGTYRFRVEAVDDAGVVSSAEATIAVGAAPAAPGSTLTARLDHALRPGQRSSLRAWPALVEGDAVASVTWTQIEGPAALDLDTSVPQRLLFTAPAVERDALLRFRATLTTRSGAVDSDEVSVLVEALPPPPAGQLFSDRIVQRVHAYRVGGPYADRLVDCAYSPALFFDRGRTNLCRLAWLPLLAAEAPGAVPSVEAIMDRVVVSHDWMGEALERFLRTQDGHGDFRRLFSSVTAIVLGSHLRPSFYWAATGAIYIDARWLWLNARQRDTVGEAPDFRLAFQRELAYSAPWRYTVGNAPAQLDFPYESRALTREVSYLVYELGPLLYHELAHANDYFPPAIRDSVDDSRLVYQAVPAALPSDHLAAAHPLISAEMFALARVKFFGAEPSDEQRAYTPEQVAGFFRADRASDEYAYAKPDGAAHPVEDVAMLFEEFMMSYRYGARRDVAFTPRRLEGQTSADLLVAWGVRGRVGDPVIRPRARQVLADIAPWIDSAAVDALPPPVPMRAGESWADNLNLLANGTLSRAAWRRMEAAGARGLPLDDQLQRPYGRAPRLLR